MMNEELKNGSIESTKKGKCKKEKAESMEECSRLDKLCETMAKCGVSSLKIDGIEIVLRENKRNLVPLVAQDAKKDENKKKENDPQIKFEELQALVNGLDGGLGGY